MDIKFTKTHLWVRELEEGVLLMGLSGHAVMSLERVEYIDTTILQRVVKSGEDMGSVESTKTASSIVCPFDLEILDKRDDSEIDLDKFNENPESEDNWLYKVSPKGDYKDALMSAEDYAKTLGMPDETA